MAWARWGRGVEGGAAVVAPARKRQRGGARGDVVSAGKGSPNLAFVPRAIRRELAGD